jgi:two-component system nitrogen regulation response regulator NtrX
VSVDVRVLAATNKDLVHLNGAGQFRADLLYRLNVVPIHITPLRDRPEDVAPLVRHFVARQENRLGHPIGVDAGAMSLLAAYPWPGNVRELANVVERLAILATSPTVSPEDVARVMPPAGAAAPSTPGEPWQDVALAEAVDRFERTLIARALSVTRGNVADAARRLSTDRANLYRRMRRLGLEPPRHPAA